MSGKQVHGRTTVLMIAVIAVLLVLLAVLIWGLLWPMGMPVGEQDKPGETVEPDATQAAGDTVHTPEPTIQSLAFPYSLEEGKLTVDSLFQYSGYNPDCGDEMGEDIASLVITNRSEEHLAEARLTVTLADGKELAFEVRDLPAGQTVWAFAKDNSAYALSNFCTAIAGTTQFEQSTPLMADRLSAAVQETEVTLTNNSAEAIAGVTVYCHTVFKDVYFGGTAYAYAAGDIPAGGSATVSAVDCYLGEAAVVRIGAGD